MNLRTGISPLQLFIICFNCAFGTTIITLPRLVGEVAKEDMWLSVVLGGIALLFSVWSVIKLSQYFPKYNCIEYHRILLGPFLGQAVNILLVFIMVMVQMLSMRTFAMLLNLFLLDSTPGQIEIIGFLMLAVYAVQYGLGPILRLQHFIFMATYFLFTIFVLQGFMAVDTENYQPFLAKGFIPVLQGVIPTWFAYTGPELMIGMLYSLVSKKKSVLKYGVASVAALTVMYTLITVIVQGILSAKEATHMIAPTIIAYRSVEIPDSFIERVDGYLMMFFIPIVFAFLVDFLYITAFAVAQMAKLESSRPIAVLFVPIIFYLAVVPPNFQAVAVISKLINAVGIAWSMGVLPLLLGIAWVRGKRRSLC